LEVKPWVAVVVIVVVIVIIGAIWIGMTRKPAMPTSPGAIPGLETMKAGMKGGMVPGVGGKAPGMAGKMPEGQAPEGKAPEGKAPEGKAPAEAPTGQ